MVFMLLSSWPTVDFFSGLFEMTLQDYFFFPQKYLMGYGFNKKKIRMVFACKFSLLTHNFDCVSIQNKIYIGLFKKEFRYLKSLYLRLFLMVSSAGVAVQLTDWLSRLH